MSCLDSKNLHRTLLTEHRHSASSATQRCKLCVILPASDSARLLSIQDHVSGTVLSEPHLHALPVTCFPTSIRSCVSESKNNMLLLAATTRELPQRSACCRCSSLSSVFFIPPHYSPHTLSNYVNISSVTCHHGMPQRAHLAFSTA